MRQVSDLAPVPLPTADGKLTRRCASPVPVLGTPKTLT